MAGAVKFTFDPRQDLSARPDFTFDLMKGISEKAKAAAEQAPELVAIRQKADASVSVSMTLTAIKVDVDIAADEEAVSEDERKAAQEGVNRAVNEAIKAEMGAVLQAAIDSSRSRMS